MSTTTLDKKYFARNADGSLKRKQGCQTEGCSHPNWHVCLLGKEDKFESALKRENLSSMGKGRKAGFVMDDWHRENIRAAVQAKFAARNAQTKQRDQYIIRDFESGMSKVNLAAKYGMSVTKLRGVLKRRDEIMS